MSLAQLEARALAICFGPPPTDSDLATLGSQPSRWLLYRAMLQGRLIDMIESAFPRATDAIGVERLRAAARDWLAEAPPKTPYVREVPVAFGAWLREPGAIELDAATLDLVEWELAIWSAGYDYAPFPRVADLDFALAPALNPTLRVVVLRHRVHLAGAHERADASTVTLAVFRDARTHAVRWRELDDASARFIALALAGHGTTTTLFRRVAAELAVPVNEAFVARLASALGAWLSDGLLLGAAVLADTDAALD